MIRFEQRLEDDAAWLGTQDIETFHLYAFGTCRQCGATAELAASFVDWLAAHDTAVSNNDDLVVVADAFRTVATAAKALQFSLARRSTRPHRRHASLVRGDGPCVPDRHGRTCRPLRRLRPPSHSDAMVA